MPRDWHETFRAWAKPPSETEETKASNAARMINDAVRETGVLSARHFTVYATGSYRNNTNIRLGSDVDVALVLKELLFYRLPAGRRPEEFGLGSSPPYRLDDFRQDVAKALSMKFGGDVKPGNKAFRIAGNSNRLPADATPFLLHRAYSGQRNADGSWNYVEGVETRPVDRPDRRVINWHQEHYDNGVSKNDATNRRYKRVARILKRLRDDMSKSGAAEARAAAAPMASFLLECLAFNAADSCFNSQGGTYHDDVRAVIVSMRDATKADGTAAVLQEVSKRKLLFGTEQAWTRAQAHEFLLQASTHIGFK